MIECSLFTNSGLVSITIPDYITKISEYAFNECLNLGEVIFSEGSKLSVIEKGSFYNTAIQEIKIPNHVTEIQESTFEGCSLLRSVELQPNSEMKKIEKLAFNDSSIESLTIPSSLVEFENGWCNRTLNLSKFNVIPGNLHFKSFEDQFILGKSSLENDVFDILIFLRRNLSVAKIPDFIETIAPYSFDECCLLSHVGFLGDSKLKKNR